MFFAFQKVSRNRKTGPIATVWASRMTCPPNCSLKGEKGCYVENFPMKLHWDALDTNGLNFDEMLDHLRTITKKALWRYGVAGDLPGEDGVLYRHELERITWAGRHSRGFAYTHYSPKIRSNLNGIHKANDNGFTVNCSADNLTMADEYMDLDVPTIVLLPSDAPKVTHTPKGRRIVTCPNQTLKSAPTCADCQLCAVGDRDYIIGFRAHGARKKKVELIARGEG